MDTMETLGGRLRWAVNMWAKQAGITDGAVRAFSELMKERRVKYAVPTLYSYFNDEVTPGADFVIVAAQACNVDPGWLLSGRGTPFPDDVVPAESYINTAIGLLENAHVPGLVRRSSPWRKERHWAFPVVALASVIECRPDAFEGDFEGEDDPLERAIMLAEKIASAYRAPMEAIGVMPGDLYTSQVDSYLTHLSLALQSILPRSDEEAALLARAPGGAVTPQVAPLLARPGCPPYGFNDYDDLDLAGDERAGVDGAGVARADRDRGEMMALGVKDRHTGTIHRVVKMDTGKWRCDCGKRPCDHTRRAEVAFTLAVFEAVRETERNRKEDTDAE